VTKSCRTSGCVEAPLGCPKAPGADGNWSCCLLNFAPGVAPDGELIRLLVEAVVEELLPDRCIGTARSFQALVGDDDAYDVGLFTFIPGRAKSSDTMPITASSGGSIVQLTPETMQLSSPQEVKILLQRTT
jgi:hypothetical protein